MVFVGLTGGIASGKSAVSRMLSECGAQIIDADALAHRAIEPDRHSFNQIVDAFGAEVLNPDRTIDRTRLGRVIFHDPEKRAWLNAIVHPAVFADAERRRQEICQQDPKAVVIFDAALLIETGAHELMDKVILVTADRRTQLKRLMARDGLSREEALARIDAQLPVGRKKRCADYVIDGTRDPDAIRAAVGKIYVELQQIAAAPY